MIDIVLNYQTKNRIIRKGISSFFLSACVAVLFALALFSGMQSLYAQAAPSPAVNGTGMIVYPISTDSMLFSRDDFFTFIWDDTAMQYVPYEFILVPLNPGQNPKEAIYLNDTILYKDSILNYYLNYPWDAPNLDTGAYAWGVKKNGASYDVASFRIYDHVAFPVKPLRLPNYYAKLQERLDGSFQVVFDKRLWIHYKEWYQVSTTQGLRFRIWNAWRTLLIAETDETGHLTVGNIPLVPIQYGDNWLQINLESCIGIGTSPFYYLEVWNEKGETEYLRFNLQQIILSLPNQRFP